MADIKINEKLVVSQTGTAEPVMASNVTIPAAGITGTLGSGVFPAGHVLQVQSTAKTTTHSHTSSGTWTAVTGLSVSITPQRAGSKIMVFAGVLLGAHTAFGTFAGMRLAVDVDGGGYSGFNVGDTASGRTRATGWIQAHTSNEVMTTNASCLHSPIYDLGEVITYRIETLAQQGGYAVCVNMSGQDADAQYHARGASNITAMEVVA
jgi:hypothetical protein